MNMGPVALGQWASALESSAAVDQRASALEPVLVVAVAVAVALGQCQLARSFPLVDQRLAVVVAALEQ